MPSLRSSSVLALLALAAFACGCSKSNSAESGPATAPSAPAARAASAKIANPCKLLTQAEASAAIGAKVGPGQLTNTGMTMRCRFFTPSQDELFLDASGTDLFDTYAHTGAVPVSGMGDKALWAHSEIGSWLYIVKGSNMITLGVPRTISSMTPAIQQAGKLIASRM